MIGCLSSRRSQSEPLQLPPRHSSPQLMEMRVGNQPVALAGLVEPVKPAIAETASPGSHSTLCMQYMRERVSADGQMDSAVMSSSTDERGSQPLF